MHIPDHRLIDILLQSPLFNALSGEELAQLLEHAHGRVRSYTPGSLIARAGDELNYLYLVLEGRVKGEMMDQAARVIHIEDIDPPNLLAPAFLFGKRKRFPVQVIASNQVRLFAIPRENFIQMMQENQKVLESFLHIVSSRGQFLSEKIMFLSFASIRSKLASYLLEHCDRFGMGPFELEHSQSQLAELFGVARPSVGRGMVALNREGLISTSGRRVEILDMQGLKALLT